MDYALHSFYVVSCIGGLRKICRPEFPGLKIVLCMRMLCGHIATALYFAGQLPLSIKCCEWTLCTFRGRDIASRSVQESLLLHTMTHAQFLCMPFVRVGGDVTRSLVEESDTVTKAL